jgi:hypothetical protein
MPTSVANFHTAGAADRLVTFANEIISSQSARQAEFNEHDRERATAYLDRLDAYVEVISNPANPLDLPKTHPTAYPIAEFPSDEQTDASLVTELNEACSQIPTQSTPGRWSCPDRWASGPA